MCHPGRGLNPRPSGALPSELPGRSCSHHHLGPLQNGWSMLSICCRRKNNPQFIQSWTNHSSYIDLYISLPILLSESDERRIDRCCAKEIIRSLLKHCLSRNRYFKNNDLTWTIFCPLCSVFMNKGSNSRLFACKLYLFRRLW